MSQENVEKVYRWVEEGMHGYVAAHHPRSLYPIILCLGRSGPPFLIELPLWKDDKEKEAAREQARAALAECQAVAYALIGDGSMSAEALSPVPGDHVLIGAAEEGGLSCLSIFQIDRDAAGRIARLRLDGLDGPLPGAWTGAWAELLGTRA